MKSPNRPEQAAFTLIELLAVVCFIAIINSVSIPAISKIQGAQRNAAV